MSLSGFAETRPGRMVARTAVIVTVLMMSLLAQTGFAQQQQPPTIFQNYFVTGDYVVAGWIEGKPDGSGLAPGTITVPDTLQPAQPGVPSSVPPGADIVAAYLYWATVEGNQSLQVGKNGFFNNYPITGTVLGNPNAPVSWSSGGCSGSANGSKTMRTYRADVRPYLPVDTNPLSPTFGLVNPNTQYSVRLADSGSNGNTQPNALGATLVIIYRVLSPNVPLNGIVLYDGAYAPSNTSSTFTDKVVGFYQPATNPTTAAKITHIVANGQLNKNEQVYLAYPTQPLPSLYGTSPPFPGIYGTWDNPTWNISNYVTPADTFEMTNVVPSSSNSGCVSWGAIIVSTPVQDSDGDGLLDVWETNQGYADAVSGNLVALPGANPGVPDIFVELDYLVNYLADGVTVQHSHLPKQAALDQVGAAFAAHNVKVHFDVGNIYQGDPYVVSSGTGGNAISEGALVCSDNNMPPLCAFPNQAAVGWKGGLLFVRDNASVPNSNPPQPLGNFQRGRGQSYHYMLFGHSLGWPRSAWNTAANALSLATIPQLVSIVNSGNSATVTIQSPPGTLQPGNCPNAAIPECSDANNNRVTLSGAFAQPNLNGTYYFSNVNPPNPPNNIVTTTTFTIATSNVADGTYKFSCTPAELAAVPPCHGEPQLGVAYLGPSSSSGHSDFDGGGDSEGTLGLWRFDDPANCQPDPSQPLTAGNPVYCNDQVGSASVQAGTLMHELGHTLTLTHGGTYYKDGNNPSLATYELNCKPNFLSNMNYLFQIRGFVEGGAIDYSGQTLTPLNEIFPALSESAGIGLDFFTSQPAAHLTRWYSAPNSLDIQLQSTTGGRYATRHCDGSPLTPADVPAVRVDGTVGLNGTFSSPLDFNNDLIFPDAILAPGVDLNYNGLTGDSPFSGFDDWKVLFPPGGPGPALRQVGARTSVLGFSGGGQQIGGGGQQIGGGGQQIGGGGQQTGGGGQQIGGGGQQIGGGGQQIGGGGDEQDAETANSTVDPPSGLTAQASPQSTHYVLLNWFAPGCQQPNCVPFAQIRTYYIWRAVGSFPTLAAVKANISQFTNIGKVTGSPPATTFTDKDKKLQNKTTYTYFVTDVNKQGVQSGPAVPAVFRVVF